MILHGSLRHNLDLAGLRTDDQVMEALKAVGLLEMVATIEGLDGDLQAKVGKTLHIARLPVSSSLLLVTTHH